MMSPEEKKTIAAVANQLQVTQNLVLEYLISDHWKNTPAFRSRPCPLFAWCIWDVEDIAPAMEDWLEEISLTSKPNLPVKNGDCHQTKTTNKMELIKFPNGFYCLKDIPQESIQSTVDNCTQFAPVEFCILIRIERYQGKIIEYHTTCGQEVCLEIFKPTKINTDIIYSPTNVEGCLPPSQFYALFFTRISGNLVSYLRIKHGVTLHWW